MNETTATLDETLRALGIDSLGKDAPPEGLMATVERVKTWRANGASPEEVAVAGTEIRNAWKRAGADRPAELWEATAPPKAEGVGAGETMDLRDPVPWEDPVEGAPLAEELLSVVTRHIALPRVEEAHGIVLWILFSHAHDAFPISPLLAITSPVKRCGKTTLLDLLGTLCPRALHGTSLTPAVTFRSVEKWCPTLLADEANTFLWGQSELRGVLDSGHRKATAFVPRAVGEDWEPRLFRTWCPKAIALIGDLHDTLEDRSIKIAMRRRNPGEKIERLRLDRVEQYGDLQRKAWRWAQDHLRILEEMDPALPESLHDRQRDNWRPLVAISDLLGEDWPIRSRRAAETLSGASEADSEDAKTLLLEDLRNLFTESGEDRISSASIVEKLHDLEDRPWPEWGRSKKPISAPALARLLKPFGVKPRALWIEDKTRRGYALEDLGPLFSRYLPPPRCKARKDQGNTTVSDDPQGVRDGGAPYTLELGENPSSPSTLTPLTPPDGGSGARGFSGETMDLFQENAP